MESCCWRSSVRCWCARAAPAASGPSGLGDDERSTIGAAERNDLLEVLDDRVGTRSTLITSQLPVKAWHTYLDDPTLADAILDRVVHSSHKIELKGRSLRDQARPAHDTAAAGDQA